MAGLLPADSSDSTNKKPGLRQRIIRKARSKLQPDQPDPASRPQSNAHIIDNELRPAPKSGSEDDSDEHTLVDQPPSETASASIEDDPSDEYDARTKSNLWAIAEQRLRDSAEKGKIMQEYDRILEEKMGFKLEPVGTPERQKQFLDFIDLESKKLDKRAKDISCLGKYTEKAKTSLRTVVDCVLAIKGVINTAASACLPAAIACAGVTVLLTVSGTQDAYCLMYRNINLM